jgi:hypothetical protein
VHSKYGGGGGGGGGGHISFSLFSLTSRRRNGVETKSEKKVLRSKLQRLV